MRGRPFTVLGAAGVAAGCAGMVAMLPSAVASALGAIGITGSSAIAGTLSQAAEPLFLASSVLLVIGALRCSRLVVLFAVSGSGLLYLSMFQFASPRVGSGSSTSMTSMQQAHNGVSAPHADATSFYLGLILLAVALALYVWRRHRRACRPLVRVSLPGVR